MEAVDAFFVDLSNQIQFPVDQVKFIFLLLANYPAAFIFKLIPNSLPNVKHVYSIVLSLASTIFLLGAFDCIHSIVSSLVTYLILRTLPHGIAHKVAFTWAFGYMSVSHIYRQYVDYMGWTLDFTTMQMVLTLKLTSFAVNYYDGKRKPEELTEDQKKRSISKLPNLLEYYGFVYFIGGYLAGPTIEITEYQNLISGKMFNDMYCQGKAPSSFFPALSALFKGFAFLPLVILSGKFPLSYLLTDQFINSPLIERCIRIYVHTALCRQRYYFGWFLAEGSCNASGVGYNGVDKQGKPKWDRCRNMDVVGVELAPNIRSITTYWNMRTGDWLKNYVYLRLTPEGQRPTPFATIATYAMSAFWHGFYPGYYLFFLASGVMTEIGKDARRVLRPYFMKSETEAKYPQKYFYDIFTIVTTVWFANYLGASFLMLSLENNFRLYNPLYWFGHVILIITFILFRFVFVGKKTRPPPKQQDGEKSKKSQ